MPAAFVRFSMMRRAETVVIGKWRVSLAFFSRHLTAATDDLCDGCWEFAVIVEIYDISGEFAVGKPASPEVLI